MARETKEVLTDCTLCYHSCGTRVTVEDGRAVKVEGLDTHPLNKGKLCPKGEAALDNVYHPARLMHPLKKVDGRLGAGQLGPGPYRDRRKAAAPEGRVRSCDAGCLQRVHRRREPGDGGTDPAIQGGLRIAQLLLCRKHLLPHAHPHPADHLRQISRRRSSTRTSISSGGTTRMNPTSPSSSPSRRT